MAEIVIAAATVHGPMLALEPSYWMQRAQDEMANGQPVLNTLDGRFLTYQEALAEFGARHGEQPDIEQFTLKAELSRQSLERMKEDLRAAAPDVLIVIGNDQDELFDEGCVPAISIFHGETIRTLKRDETGYPEWRKRVSRAYGLDKVRDYAGAPDMARCLIKSVVAAGFDVTTLGHVPNPEHRGFGHALGYVMERFFDGSPPPTVPIMLNTYTPLNTVPVGRCFAFGIALRRAIEQAPSAARVGVIASGGLSHFFCEEEFDRAIMGAIEAHSYEELAKLPEAALRSGSSEIRSWVALGGMVSGLELQWTNYIPVPRTPVGTGQGFGWALWRGASLT